MLKHNSKILCSLYLRIIEKQQVNFIEHETACGGRAIDLCWLVRCQQDERRGGPHCRSVRGTVLSERRRGITSTPVLQLRQIEHCPAHRLADLATHDQDHTRSAYKARRVADDLSFVSLARTPGHFSTVSPAPNP